MCTWKLLNFQNLGHHWKFNNLKSVSAHLIVCTSMGCIGHCPLLIWSGSEWLITSESFNILNLGFSHCSTTYLDITRNWITRPLSNKTCQAGSSRRSLATVICLGLSRYFCGVKPAIFLPYVKFVPVLQILAARVGAWYGYSIRTPGY